MTSQTFTATLPNGEIVTRTSKSRTYSHVVVWYQTATYFRDRARGANTDRGREWFEEQAARADAQGGSLAAVMGWTSRLDLAERMRRRRPEAFIHEVTVKP